MNLEEGSIVEGIVTGLAKFGAFVKLDEETSGLVHISEISDRYVEEVSDFLKVGDKVKVKITNIEPNGKIAVSIKQAMAPNQQEKGAREVPPAVTLSKVVRKSENTNFDDMLSKFMKDSNEKIESAKQRKNVRQGKTRKPR